MSYQSSPIGVQLPYLNSIDHQTAGQGQQTQADKNRMWMSNQLGLQNYTDDQTGQFSGEKIGGMLKKFCV